MTGDDARPKFLLALALRILALIGLSVLPGLTGRAIDVISTNGSSSALQKWVIAALVAGSIYLAISFIADRMFGDLATQASYKLQNHLFSHMQTLSLSFFDRQGRGELMSRLTNDSEVIAFFYESAVTQIVRAVSQIVLSFLVMVFIDWRLTIVAILIIPVMLFVMNVANRISSPAFAKLQEDLSTMSGFQEETLSGNKVIISKRRQKWADEKNVQLASQVFDDGSKAFFTSLLQYPLTQSLTYLQIVIVLVVGGLMSINGRVELGTVIAFSGYVGLLAKPVSTISNLISTALNGVAGGRRVFSIIDEVPTVKDAPDASNYVFKGGHIQCQHVDFSYVKGRKILRHNTFDVQPGEAIGICGPTGAGKSTLINILTRYYDIDSGTILIDGQDLSKLSQESLRKQVGVVLQEAFLFTDTVMINLKYAREGATDEDCIEAAKEANAHDELMAQKGFYYSLYMSQFKGKAPAGASAADVDFVST